MVKNDEDFYFEDYRSVKAQVQIIRLALKADKGLRQRALRSKQPNQWMRNVLTYLGNIVCVCVLIAVANTSPQSPHTVPSHSEAEHNDKLHLLTVKTLWEERPLVDPDHLPADVVAGEDAAAAAARAYEAVDDYKVDTAVATDDTEQKAESPDRPVPGELQPRSRRGFYNNLMAGQRLWKRPPDDYCSRCAQYETTVSRLSKLTDVLCAVEGSPQWLSLGAEQELALAGGRNKAAEEQRTLQKRLPDLLKHVTWRQKQRQYLTARHRDLQPHESIWQLDYGGITDSQGRKVNVWSCTILPNGHQKQFHFDFFFDSANQRQLPGQEGHKKDGQAGIYFMGELLDKAKHPTRPGELSMLADLFPKTTHLILSGDTGNGYRAYEMLEELSTITAKHQITIELIPLAPGHAFNRTDTRIAHMNTFIRGILRSSRVIGAKAMASMFSAASDPKQANRRKFLRGKIVLLLTFDSEVRADYHPAQGASVSSGWSKTNQPTPGGATSARK
jgi:hypothetical protein